MSDPSTLPQPVDPASVVPFYAQVKEDLVKRLAALEAHTRLPSESELEREYGVSRTVVRRALMELAGQGLIYRRKGKGTFVAEPKVVEGQIQGLAGFFDEMVKRGYQPTTSVLAQEVTHCTHRLAGVLEMKEDARLIRIVRLRSVGGQPLAHSESHIPYDLCPGLENVDLRDRSLYGVLQAEFQVKAAEAHRTLQLDYAGSALARALKTRTGSPIIRIDSLVRDDSGRIVEHSVASHRGDRAKFEFSIADSHASEREGNG